jgi:VIT1/CCC1 family predicted Fe2+/Mn2+ transporter
MGTLGFLGEGHPGARMGWLRAVVLGADDGIVTVAAIALGVSAAAASHAGVVTAATAALVAGALSMAAGEYVSVSSQRDSERSSVARERQELVEDPEGETAELTRIYLDRGLPPDLARRVAEQLMAGDALSAHVRDELGFSKALAARPLQAALASGSSFFTGALIPLLAILLAPRSVRDPVMLVVSLATLAALGWVGARVGGGSPVKASVRVVVGGGVAMAVTVGIGRLLGASGL